MHSTGFVTVLHEIMIGKCLCAIKKENIQHCTLCLISINLCNLHASNESPRSCNVSFLKASKHGLSIAISLEESKVKMRCIP